MRYAFSVLPLIDDAGTQTNTSEHKEA